MLDELVLPLAECADGRPVRALVKHQRLALSIETTAAEKGDKAVAVQVVRQSCPSSQLGKRGQEV